MFLSDRLKIRKNVQPKEEPAPDISNKILLVDDDPGIHALYTGQLSELAEVIPAFDGMTAVRLYEEHNPKVIVLDIMLPQKSGFLVFERIRQRRKQGEPPYVLMITRLEGRRHRQYAEALGVDEYLQKPVRLERLTALVKLYLEKEDV
ncbi:MAG: response regulator [Candidatus Woesearchaeota archaeon]